MPNWKVLTPDRLPKDKDWVYYGLTPKDYEALAKALADAIRNAKESRYQLCYYRKEKNCDRFLK